MSRETLREHNRTSMLDEHDVRHELRVLTVKVVESLTDANETASRLTVEVTEISLMADPVGATSSPVEMSSAGVRVSVDDFGSDETSL